MSLFLELPVNRLKELNLTFHNFARSVTGKILVDPYFAFVGLIQNHHLWSQEEASYFRVQSLATNDGLFKQVENFEER